MSLATHLHPAPEARDPRRDAVREWRQSRTRRLRPGA